MPEIRIKEKRKDIRTIDRMQTAAYHVKNGYVRTKETLADETAEQSSASSEYAEGRVEQEMKRAADSAAHRIVSQSRNRRAGIRERTGDIGEQEGEEDIFSQGSGGADPETGIAERRKEDIRKRDICREIYEESSGTFGQSEGKERSGSLRYGRSQTARQDMTTYAGIRQERADWTPEEKRELSIYEQTVKNRTGFLRSSMERDREAGEKRWIREREKAEWYIKEPAHATGKQNRPILKNAWERHEKVVRTSGNSIDRFWYRQSPAASGQYAYAVERLQPALQKNVVSMGRGLMDAGRSAGAGMRRIGETAKAVFTSTKVLVNGLLSGSAAVVLIILVVALFGGIFLTSVGNNPEGSGENLSQEVISYTPLIRQYAQQYGIPLFVNAIQAMMMQESGGRGTDPMQSSECPYNTRFPNSPGAITEPEYSIAVGIQYFASCLAEAGCESPMDIDKLSLAWQGYNFGNGYITWAVQNFGGYSGANAQVFSEQQAASHGWSGYGDPQYVPYVMRYYQYSGGFLLGDERLVDVARTQIGNQGGQPYWSWFGFSERVPWCACFVSWCADQCGYIEAGILPRFSVCDDGISWFREKGQYAAATYIPRPGDLIFFDWDRDGISDHVGIVASVEGGSVHTVEGNTSNICAERIYLLGDGRICGYGKVAYDGEL